MPGPRPEWPPRAPPQSSVAGRLELSSKAPRSGLAGASRASVSATAAWDTRPLRGRDRAAYLWRNHYTCAPAVRYRRQPRVVSLSLLEMLRGWSPFDISRQGPWGVSRVALGASDRTQPADPDSAGRPRASIGACRSRTNADDRLPADPLGRIEGGDGIVEGRDGADVRPQSSVPHPLDDLTQLGTIGLDNEVDR